MENPAIMISIQPKWCHKIILGEKTIEIRKSRPKMEPPFVCYIYCTKPSVKNQTVCGSMVLNNDELYRHPDKGIKYGNSIELMMYDDYTEDNFLNGKVIGKFVCDKIELLDVSVATPFTPKIIEDSKVSATEMWEYSKGKDLYLWHISDYEEFEKPKRLSDFYSFATGSPLSRAPQSWCYTGETWKEKN